MSTPDVMHLERLALDVDTRIADIWSLAYDRDAWDLEAVGEFIRSAYAAGYMHALTESRRGQLLIDNGYTVPRRGR